ncbi:MAG: PKD domain-containing protein [Sphingobacteriales bacterium]|nr:PKD domain-containing protein [Sphingobacteriales bacterium]
MTPTFHLIIDIGALGTNYYKVEGSFETALQQSISAGGSVGSISKKVKIYEQPLAPITLFGFLVINPNLNLNIGANASINVSVSATQNINSNVSASLEYKNSTWNKDYTQTMQATYNFSGINGNADMKIFLEPAIEFKLFDSDNLEASVSAQGYVKASGTLLPVPDCELKAGVSAGAEAKFLGIASVSYPEIFDYSKSLFTCSTNQAPTADFSASQTAITTGNSVNFTDLSTGNPTSWSWSFQGGTPATSTLQNPTNIQYNTAGTYTVSLVATNANGNDTKTKTGYIVVSDVNPQLPTLTTTAITNPANTTATSGGIITSQGTSSVTARGVCWSTAQNPTIANSKTTDGTGTGSFTSNLTGLTTNTTYYVRAYATNTTGTSYGNEQSFTTTGSLANCGTVTDIDGMYIIQLLLVHNAGW